MTSVTENDTTAPDEGDLPAPDAGDPASAAGDVPVPDDELDTETTPDESESRDEPLAAEASADAVGEVPEPEAGPGDQPSSGELDGGPAAAAIAEATGAQPEDIDAGEEPVAAEEAALTADAAATEGAADPDDPAMSSTASEQVASEDELDDLLGMAGAEVEEPTEAAVADDPARDEAAADAAEDIAASDAEVAEPVEEPAEKKPRRPRRPNSLDDVKDQKDLRRMKGRWFVVHTYAGYEQRVKDNLTNRVETYDAWDRIHEIVIPTEEVTEYKKGKKVISDKKFLPGYVLVRMDMDDDTWGIVRHTPAVTGFVGANGIKPVPLSMREVANTLKIPKEYIEESEEAAAEGGGEGGDAHVVPEKPQIDIDLEVGETVRVTTGPFADFTGTIDEINLDQAKLRVLVSVFGRETPIEIPFDNVASI